MWPSCWPTGTTSREGLQLHPLELIGTETSDPGSPVEGSASSSLPGNHPLRRVSLVRRPLWHVKAGPAADLPGRRTTAQKADAEWDRPRNKHERSTSITSST